MHQAILTWHKVSSLLSPLYGPELKIMKNKMVKNSGLKKQLLIAWSLLVCATSCASAALAVGINLPINDPGFPSQWNLGSMHVPGAWAYTSGSYNIGIISGSATNGSISELTGKVTNRVISQSAQPQDFGTGLATIAAAHTNNRINTAGIAPAGRVFSYTADLNPRVDRGTKIIAALQRARTDNCKIVVLNLPQVMDAPNEFFHEYFDRSEFVAVHDAMQQFHDQFGGLIFVGAGDRNREDRNTNLLPYLIVVSSLDPNENRAPNSNSGIDVWFGAPGHFIACSDSTGRMQFIHGSHVAAMNCAAVAALIWSTDTRLTNVQVEQLLVQTARRPTAASRTNTHGFGIPDAEAAVRRVWNSLPWQRRLQRDNPPERPFETRPFVQQ